VAVIEPPAVTVDGLSVILRLERLPASTVKVALFWALPKISAIMVAKTKIARLDFLLNTITYPDLKRNIFVGSIVYWAGVLNLAIYGLSKNRFHAIIRNVECLYTCPFADAMRF